VSCDKPRRAGTAAAFFAQYRPRIDFCSGGLGSGYRRRRRWPSRPAREDDVGDDAQKRLAGQEPAAQRVPPTQDMPRRSVSESHRPDLKDRADPAVS